jgi:hypothetical protein
MHKKNDMQKMIIIVAIIAVAGVAGFMFMRGRFSINASAKVAAAPGQIILLNDSTDTISVEYKVGDKEMAPVLAPGAEIACGDKGIVRVFTAGKMGSYELTYPVDQKERRVALSQIVQVSKKDNVAEEILVETGMVGDIKVMYEEVVSDE